MPSQIWCSDELPCEISGFCEGQRSERELGICNCTHCGKELHYKNGNWYTWDADLYENPRPQYEDFD